MYAIVLSLLLLLPGFCIGIPEGLCAPSGVAKLHLDEHYTASAESVVPPDVHSLAEPGVHPTLTLDGTGVQPVVNTASPEMFPPAPSGKPLLVLFGIALLPAVYFLRRKGAVKEIDTPELSGTPKSSYLPDRPPRSAVVPEKAPEESWPDLAELTDDTVPEESPGSPPEEESSLSQIRCKAAETGEVDTGRLMVLLEKVRNPHDHSRLIYWMGRFGVKEALPRILRELAHPVGSVRMAAAAALVHLKNDRVEERMIEMAEERDPNVRKAALLVLSRIGSARCHEVVRKSCWDFEPEVREAAAIALGRLQVPDADFDLRQILSDFEEEVRLQAVRASGQLREGMQQEGG